MKNKIVHYELALRLKQLGFDEPCFATYQKRAIGSQKPFEYDLDYHTKVQMSSNIIPINSEYTEESKWISAPTWQSAFRWFREKYQLHSTITSISQESWQWHITKPGESLGKLYDEDFYTYEETELACLKKLIEIVENEKTL